MDNILLWNFPSRKVSNFLIATVVFFSYNVLMFTKSDRQSFLQRKEFIAQMQKETGAVISSMEFAELRGDSLVYGALGIETEVWQLSVWGLLLFTDKGIFYYTTTQENYLMRLTSRSSKYKAKESLINLSELKDLQFTLPRRNFLSFLQPELKRTINACFSDGSGKRIYFRFVTHTDAFSIYEKLK